MKQPHPFSFLESVESLRPQLRDLAVALQANGRFLGLEKDEAHGRANVRRLAAFARDGDRAWKLKRLYLSYQASGPHFSAGCRGHTFFYDPRKGGLRECAFPEDPKLNTAAHVLSRLEAGGRVDVLRYVPLRRLTLRGHWGPSGGPAIIVKVAEGGATDKIARRLLAVKRAAEGFSFRVAGLLMHDESGSTIAQECLPGQPLLSAITHQNLEQTMGRLGALHAEVHDLPVPEEACGRVEDPWSTVLDRLDWLAWVRPVRADVFRHIRFALENGIPEEPPERRVFCHGDFRCTQILGDADRWGVIDFDESGYGDLCQDVGRFLAFLKYDVPLVQDAGDEKPREQSALLERAESAYLDGYARRAGRAPDPGALLWHRVCQEVLHLAQRVRRDLADEEEFGRGCARIENLCARLGGQKSQHPGAVTG